MKKGLKTVALLEASKGLISLLVGLGIHQLAGNNIQQLLESMLSHLHLNPASHLPGLFVHEARLITHANLMWIAIGAIVYALVRFVEAFGLWHEYRWTEWFALISGGIYLPFELYEVIAHLGPLSVGTLLINLIVVGYMYHVVRES